MGTALYFLACFAFGLVVGFLADIYVRGPIR